MSNVLAELGRNLEARGLGRSLAAGRLAHRVQLADGVALLGAVLLTYLVARWNAQESRLALAPLAALVGIGLFVSPRFRTLFVLTGALITLQSDDELTLTKLAYFAGVGAAFIGATIQLGGLSTRRVPSVALPIIRGSAVFGFLIMASLLVARANGIPDKDWMRDVAPYLLVACAPVLALDASRSFTRKALVRLLVLAGGISALSYVISWVHGRGLADLAFTQIGFPSFALAGALVAYGSSAFLVANQRRAAWAVCTSALLGLMLLTGNRGTLALLVAPLAVVLVGSARFVSRIGRLAALVPLLLVIGALTFVSAVRVADVDRERLTERSVLLFRSGRAGTDQSYDERVAQTAAAWDAFQSQPLVGVGPGHKFEWRDSQGELTSSFVPDTPLSLPAKFGLIGVAAVLVLVLGYMRSIRAIRRRLTQNVGVAALIAFGAIMLARAVLQLPFDDKGLGLGLILLVAIVLRQAEARDE